jgi:hypothetical protein
MKLRHQLGRLLIAIGISAAMALPSVAQKPQANRPPQPQNRPANNPPKPQSQPRPPRQSAPAPRNNGGQNSNARPAGNTNPNRPPNAGGDPRQRPNFNPNRPPNAGNPQANARRFQDLSPAEKQKVLENNRRLQKLSPAERQELKKREEIFTRLTPEQKSHIRNDLVPRWQQMSPDRQRAIRQRLGVLQNMPESARNQHLNDPNFTRGMSEEDKATLRDLSHMHVGAPDPPGE